MVTVLNKEYSCVDTGVDSCCIPVPGDVRGNHLACAGKIVSVVIGRRCIGVLCVLPLNRLAVYILIGVSYGFTGEAEPSFGNGA